MLENFQHWQFCFFSKENQLHVILFQRIARPFFTCSLKKIHSVHFHLKVILNLPKVQLIRKLDAFQLSQFLLISSFELQQIIYHSEYPPLKHVFCQIGQEVLEMHNSRTDLRQIIRKTSGVFSNVSY